ncbi:hypothetical protein KIPB_003492 [Kipferlia bialata]|uniref:Uncharacterized protein n=1 Tax=Kipferlia bialata TaxID=797122 RepID=A0A9K3CTZ0_9EUKA|nr:hypothetical protein KIPB_003492 [Kipferlia bialata]|eukprot:g3492.t1
MDIALCLIAKENYPKALTRLGIARRLAECAKTYDGRPVLASVFHDIGYVHDRQGRVSEAVHEYKKAVRIREKCFGQDSSEVADTLYCLGQVLKERGDNDGALASQLRALEIRVARMGPDSIFVAESRIRVALLYTQMNRLADAHPQAQGAFRTLNRFKDLGDKRLNASLVTVRGILKHLRFHETAPARFKRQPAADTLPVTDADPCDEVLQRPHQRVVGHGLASRTPCAEGIGREGDMERERERERDMDFEEASRPMERDRLNVEDIVRKYSTTRIE